MKGETDAVFEAQVALPLSRYQSVTIASSKLGPCTLTPASGGAEGATSVIGLAGGTPPSYICRYIMYLSEETCTCLSA